MADTPLFTLTEEVALMFPVGLRENGEEILVLPACEAVPLRTWEPAPSKLTEPAEVMLESMVSVPPAVKERMTPALTRLMAPPARVRFPSSRITASVVCVPLTLTV